MVLNDIEKLLKKYTNGETTLDEEQVLKTYFSSPTVAPHLKMYTPMFAYFLNNKQEQFTKDVVLINKLKFNYKWVAIAAVTVFMLGIYFKTPLVKVYSTYVYGTYNEPEKAFKEVSNTLAMISNHFNKGTHAIGYLDELEKGTVTLGYLNEIENTTNIIFKAN